MSLISRLSKCISDTSVITKVVGESLKRERRPKVLDHY